MALFEINGLILDDVNIDSMSGSRAGDRTPGKS